MLVFLFIKLALRQFLDETHVEFYKVHLATLDGTRLPCSLNCFHFHSFVLKVDCIQILRTHLREHYFV